VVLGNAAKPFGATDQAPILVVATPGGQVHELGALLVGTTAANLGWQVTYLGASLPAAEIAGAARQKGARAVALSLVYPEDDPQLASELAPLRESLPGEVNLRYDLASFQRRFTGPLPFAASPRSGAGMSASTADQNSHTPAARIPSILPPPSTFSTGPAPPPRASHCDRR
jgi:hypothetical protein